MTRFPFGDRPPSWTVRPRLCKGVTKDGEPCNSEFAGASGYCPNHNPGKRAVTCTAINRAGNRCKTPFGLVDGRCIRHREG